MLCYVVGQGDQSGSMMSQVYLWTLAMHVSHLPVPGVMCCAIIATNMFAA